MALPTTKRLARTRELLTDCKIAPQELEQCLRRLKKFMEPFLRYWKRREMREHGEDFVRGLLSDLDRKSTEPIAERMGKDRRGLQRFIGAANWDHRPAIEELCRQVGSEIGTPEGILVLDPTTFPKKGKKSVGVARQYCGRTGNIENCQKGVFLGYVSSLGRTLVDMRLYLPEKWLLDRERLKECHVPKSIRRQTTCELGLELIAERGKLLPHAWVTGDDEFGCNADFRMDLHDVGERYVLDIPNNRGVCDVESVRRGTNYAKLPWTKVRTWKDTLSESEWSRIEVRDGSKGPIIVHAARKRVFARWRTRVAPTPEWLIVIREEGAKTDYRYCLSNGDESVELEELVRAAAARYWIEDCFERAKGEVGLADYETRTWDGWHHHVTLSMLALWFLVKEQRQLQGGTPAITLQQSKAAIAELLRDPDLDVGTLAERITRKLKRSEQARIAHWKKTRRLPPRHKESP